MRARRPLHPLGGALFALLLGSCSRPQPTAMVVAVASEAPVPEQIDNLELVIERGGGQRFEQVYALNSDARLPGTLTVQSQAGADPASPILVTVRAKLHDDATWRVVRQARLGFVKEHTKLLRMPLRFSCFDVGCPDGKTCVGGACKAPDVDPAALPEFTSVDSVIVPQPQPGQEKSAKCFWPATCMVKPFPVTPDASCSFPIDDALSQHEASFNVGLLWKAAQGAYVVAEQDAVEGYTVSGGRVTLGEGPCGAFKQAGSSLQGVALFYECAPKAPELPVCSVTSGVAQGMGGAAGAGGQAGAGGAAGTGGTGGASGQAGTGGAGGQSGAGGAGGQSGAAGSAGAPSKVLASTCNGTGMSDPKACFTQYPDAKNVDASMPWSCSGTTCGAPPCLAGFNNLDSRVANGCECSGSACTGAKQSVVVFVQSDQGNDYFITRNDTDTAWYRELMPDSWRFGASIISNAHNSGPSGTSIGGLFAGVREGDTVVTLLQGAFVPFLFGGTDVANSARASIAGQAIAAGAYPTLGADASPMVLFPYLPAKAPQPRQSWSYFNNPTPTFTDLDANSAALVPPAFYSDGSNDVVAYVDATGVLRVLHSSAGNVFAAASAPSAPAGNPPGVATTLTNQTTGQPFLLYVRADGAVCAQVPMDTTFATWVDGACVATSKTLFQPAAFGEMGNVLVAWSDDTKKQLGFAHWTAGANPGGTFDTPVFVDLGSAPTTGPLLPGYLTTASTIPSSDCFVGTLPGLVHLTESAAQALAMDAAFPVHPPAPHQLSGAILQLQ